MASRAQVISDSLASDFRTFMAKNFSRYRTVNLYWEAKWAHDYTFSLDGQEVEKMVITVMRKTAAVIPSTSTANRAGFCRISFVVTFHKIPIPVTYQGKICPSRITRI